MAQQSDLDVVDSSTCIHTVEMQVKIKIHQFFNNFHSFFSSSISIGVDLPVENMNVNSQNKFIHIAL